MNKNTINNMTIEEQITWLERLQSSAGSDEVKLKFSSVLSTLKKVLYATQPQIGSGGVYHPAGK